MLWAKMKRSERRHVSKHGIFGDRGKRRKTLLVLVYRPLSAKKKKNVLKVEAVLVLVRVPELFVLTNVKQTRVVCQVRIRVQLPLMRFLRLCTCSQSPVNIQCAKNTYEQNFLGKSKIDEVYETFSDKSYVLVLWSTHLTVTRFGSNSQSLSKPVVTWNTWNRGSMPDTLR